MGNLFSPPKPPKPKPLLPAAAAVAELLPEETPARADEPIQEAGEDAIRQVRRSRGRASTIITALSGGDLPGGSVIRKTLLGGS